MKKFVALMMVVTLMLNVTAFAMMKPIDNLGFCDDFKYKNDTRFTTVGWEYDNDRFDLYILIGKSFVMRTSNVEDHDVVRLEVMRVNRDTGDPVIYETSYDVEDIEALSRAEKELTNVMDVLVWMMDIGWA